MHADMCTHPPGECMQTYQQILIISGMPHHLSDALKYKIVALRECQKSWKEICSILKIKRSTAQAVVKKNAETGDVKNRKSPGRPKKVKPSGHRVISRFIGRNRRATIAQITANYNTGRVEHDMVSAVTMKRTLKTMDFKKKAAARKLNISPKNRSLRVRWCRAHSNWTQEDWARIVFTDEVRVALRDDGRVKIWRRRGERYSHGCTTSTSTNRASLMFWGFISADGQGLLLTCSNGMTAQEYISVMERAAFSSLPSFGRTLMDDNAPIHRAGIVRAWKEQYDIQCIDWPAYSPDLNPIENVWGFIKRAIKPIRAASLSEVQSLVLDEWAKLPLPYIRTLYESMPRRILACVRARGAPIAY
jgi:hypothetical protein